jgi:FkbH-like protein/FkbM family methyltransferase
MLAPFAMEQGRTLVLRSIDSVAVSGAAFPDTLWAHATAVAEGDGLRGDVRVFDASDNTCLEVRGIAFSLAAHESTATRLVVAANFTAEPLEDCLKFWGEQLGAPMALEFAPYDQVFQQLLDAGSALRRNDGGVNVVLLALEEWANGNRHALMDLSPERAQRCFGSRARHVLPNGIEIAHLNRYETEYLYKEIFEEHSYLKHGIRLRDGATVLDIGANIGLFSLFVMSRCADATVYAFEPAPAAYDLLKANCDAYGLDVRTFNLGVSDRPKSAAFTFYEKSSVFSGFHAQAGEDAQAIRGVVRTMLGGLGADAAVESYVDELTADRMRCTTHECRLTSVSEVLRENRIERVDLLKIDAEKSELAILEGIADHDWPRIEQLVVEIHDRSRDTLARIEGLLRAKGYRCAVEQGRLLEQAGLFSLYATRVQSASETPAGLQRSLEDLCGALRAYSSEAAAELILCVCPRSPGAQADAQLTAALDAAESALLSEAARLANVHAIGSAALLRRYPARDYHDAHTHRAAHQPFTPQGYAAIGSAVARAVCALKSSPSKVIVLDCDNTLWKGVCGEDGACGIELTAGHRSLQEFMLGQMNAGMLLCLCSKNNEKDVLEVLDRRSDMLIKREHLAAWRMNWDSKSANLRALAQELNLGLDSFIFIDDNPVDCAEVRSGCPEVLTLQLPPDPASFATFLDHVWAFDRARTTDEDRNRTRLYQEGRRRQEQREPSMSLQDFHNSLELRVAIADATPDELGRVSQLTLRTNQFNFTTRRRSESDIRAFLQARPGARCLAVRVVDRFGDYGLVGVLMYESSGDRYQVDTLLLSCRVLGRGVEHVVVAWLGAQALGEGKPFVELTCLPTQKNRPAAQFLARLGAGPLFSSEHLARVTYQPEESTPGERAAPPASAGQRRGRIGEQLHDIERLTSAIEHYRAASYPALQLPGGSALEVALAGIWRKVLGNPRIGLHDNFFEAGGTSLKAVQLVAMIRRELRQALPIVTVFECPTLSALAARLGAASTEPQAGAAAAAQAVSRGQRRRQRAMQQ